MGVFGRVSVGLAISVMVVAVCATHGEIEKRVSLNPFAYATDLASNAIDKMGLEAVNPIKITSKLTGAALGAMGLVWGKQENKKCYYYWGLGFSGPDSWNPERWNGEKWDKEEEGGLMNAVGDVLGASFGALFSLAADEEVRVQGCKMLGMGYTKQQPGFPSKPGTCPQGPDCYGTPGRGTMPRPGDQIPGMPGAVVTYTIPGREGSVSPGTPGSVVTIVIPGKPPVYVDGTEPTSTTYTTPGTPGYYTPGTPPQMTTEIRYPGTPPQYTPGTPGTMTTEIRPGTPGQYTPGTPPITTTEYRPGTPPQYTPGTPPQMTTEIRYPGSPPQQYSPGTPQTYYPPQPQQPQPQQMCPCPCNG